MILEWVEQIFSIITDPQNRIYWYIGKRALILI